MVFASVGSSQFFPVSILTMIRSLLKLINEPKSSLLVSLTCVSLCQSSIVEKIHSIDGLSENHKDVIGKLSKQLFTHMVAILEHSANGNHSIPCISVKSISLLAHDLRILVQLFDVLNKVIVEPVLAMSLCSVPSDLVGIIGDY